MSNSADQKRTFSRRSSFCPCKYPASNREQSHQLTGWQAHLPGVTLGVLTQRPFCRHVHAAQLTPPCSRSATHRYSCAPRSPRITSRYYQDAAPTITDQEYDALYPRTRPISKERLPRVPHQRFPHPTRRRRTVGSLYPRSAISVPMLSLDNTYSESEVAEFYHRVQKDAAGARRAGDHRAENRRRSRVALIMKTACSSTLPPAATA